MFKSIFRRKWEKWEKTVKKLSSQMEIIFLEMRALWSKMDFWLLRRNNFAQTIFRYTILDILKMSKTYSIKNGLLLLGTFSIRIYVMQYHPPLTNSVAFFNKTFF
jgi:hypothetical protein